MANVTWYVRNDGDPTPTTLSQTNLIETDVTLPSFTGNSTRKVYYSARIDQDGLNATTPEKSVDVYPTLVGTIDAAAIPDVNGFLTVTLTASLSSGIPSGFTWMVSQDSKVSWTSLGSTGATPTFVSDPLDPTKTYWFRVRVEDQSGQKVLFLAVSSFGGDVVVPVDAFAGYAVSNRPSTATSKDDIWHLAINISDTVVTSGGGGGGGGPRAMGEVDHDSLRFNYVHYVPNTDYLTSLVLHDDVNGLTFTLPQEAIDALAFGTVTPPPLT